MIELHLRGRVAAGRRADLVRLLAEAIPFYERPGGIRVRVLWDLANPDRFVEIIEYADQDSHDRDQLRVEPDPEMIAYLHRWRDLLAGPRRSQCRETAVVRRKRAV